MSIHASPSIKNLADGVDDGGDIRREAVPITISVTLDQHRAPRPKLVPSVDSKSSNH
jgi:hypothetical protein